MATQPFAGTANRFCLSRVLPTSGSLHFASYLEPVHIQTSGLPARLYLPLAMPDQARYSHTPSYQDGYDEGYRKGYERGLLDGAIEHFLCTTDI